MGPRFFVPMLFASATSLLCPPSLAQTTGAEVAAAESLFAEARALLKTGQLEEACAKFEASQRLDPAAGTLLNLGDCLERAKRNASAWLAFREAAAFSRRAGDAAREREARARAQRLEPSLAKLTIRGGPSGVDRVRKDGVPIDAAMMGVAAPADPGEHVIEVERDGETIWRCTVQVEQGEYVVQIPALDRPALSEAHAPPASIAPVPHDPPPLPRDERSRAWTWTTIGVGAAGVVTGAVGTALFLRARGTYDDARSLCTLDGPSPSCPAQAKSLESDAHAQAVPAYVSWVAAGALVASAVVLWITSPRAALRTGAPRGGVGLASSFMLRGELP